MKPIIHSIYDMTIIDVRLCCHLVNLMKHNVVFDSALLAPLRQNVMLSTEL